jgi:Zn-dependent protease with chaperone function
MIYKKISLSVLFSAACTTSGFVEAEQISQSQPNKPLSKYQTFKKDIRDKLFFKNFGLMSVSPETENVIRNTIKEMDMETYNIEIRSMSDFAKKVFGTMNAFVYPSLFSKSELNLLYISEEWFDTLTPQEKRALIGHELIHIKNSHFTKGFMILITCTSLSYLAGFKLLPSQCIGLLSILFTLNWYSRLCEEEADIQSAKKLQCAADSAKLFAHFIDKTKTTRSPLQQWLKSKIKNKKNLNIINSVFTFFGDTHPKPKNRVAYMKKLAEQQGQSAVPAN